MKKSPVSTTDDQPPSVETTDHKAEIAQLKEQILRSQADYQNLVRRTQEDRLKFAKMAGQEVILAFLQPLDHLEMAVKQLKDPGLEMVLHQFQQTLTEFGVTEIDCLGKKFDAEKMEVVQHDGEVTDQTGTVKKVVSRGYMMNGSVLRHAKVIV